MLSLLFNLGDIAAVVTRFLLEFWLGLLLLFHR